MPKMPPTSVTLISCPYHGGRSGSGPASGPPFILSHGLADAIASLGLAIRQVEIEPVSSADFDGEIGASFGVLRRTSRLVASALENESFPVVLAGNCVASVGVAAGVCLAGLGVAGVEGKWTEQDGDGGGGEGKDATAGHDDKLACVWFDAHDDYNTPDTIVSGYFDSMGIAMLTGECWKAMLASVPGHRPLDVRDVVHVGMRDVTDGERARVVDSGMDVVWGGTEGKVDFQQELGKVLERKGLGRTVVHVDLDCLDVEVGKANKFAAPGGLLEEDLGGCLERVAELTAPVALTIASFDSSFDSGEGGAERIAKVAVQAIKGFLGNMKLVE